MMEQIYLLTGIGVAPTSGKDIYFSIACWSYQEYAYLAEIISREHSPR